MEHVIEKLLLTIFLLFTLIVVLTGIYAGDSRLNFSHKDGHRVPSGQTMHQFIYHLLRIIFLLELPSLIICLLEQPNLDTDTGRRKK